MKSMTILRMRLMENSISTKLSMPRTVCIAVILATMILESSQTEIPWDQWLWGMPEEPIITNSDFRRHENLPVKAPSFVCECPPHNECVVDFKINKDMADFLNMRGLLKKEDLKNFREDLKKIENSSDVYQGIQTVGPEIRNRRSNVNYEEQCCCPPKNMFMPSLMTDKEFDKMVEKFRQEETRNQNTEN